MKYESNNTSTIRRENNEYAFTQLEHRKTIEAVGQLAS